MACKKVGNAAKVSLSELSKRVPPNQSLQFKDFQAKHAEYQARVNKQPEKLPPIDWDFYRRNVRADYVKWVDEFEQKYKAVCDTYDQRDKQDTSKYYVELDKLREEVQCEIENYIAESNERIKALEEEYARIKALKPYEEMTAEEYSELLPDKSMYKLDGQPTFWPHTVDEQGPGPSVKGAHGHGDHDGGDHGGAPAGGGDGDGGKGPPAGGDPKAAVASSQANDKEAGDKDSKDKTKAMNESEKVAQAIGEKSKVAETASLCEPKLSEPAQNLSSAELSQKISDIAHCSADSQSIELKEEVACEASKSGGEKAVVTKKI